MYKNYLSVPDDFCTLVLLFRLQNHLKTSFLPSTITESEDQE